MSREKTMHELVTAAKAGDQEAITLLYERTSNKAYYLSFQLVKDEDTAQDILQDAYIKAFGSLDMLSDPEKFQGWLDTIVVNKSKDFLKKKKPVLFSRMTVGEPGGSGENEKEVDFEDDSMAFSPEKTMDYKETKRLIAEMIDELPEEQRMAVILRYLEDMPVAEIARVMECSEGTVKSRLNYGRKSIKAKVLELEKKGTKLYIIPFAGFMVWFFRSETTAYAAPNLLPKVLSALCSEAARSGAATLSETGIKESADALCAGAEGGTEAAQVAGNAAAEAAKTVGTTAANAAGAAAAKTAGTKTAALIIAACLGVGGVAAYTVAGRMSGDDSIETETAAEETEPETVSDEAKEEA